MRKLLAKNTCNPYRVGVRNEIETHVQIAITDKIPILCNSNLYHSICTKILFMEYKNTFGNNFV